MTMVSKHVAQPLGYDWYVAHTYPRCEKKLARFSEREGLVTTLPCYRSVKQYRRKTAIFRKPLFPSYLFLQLLSDQTRRVYQSGYLVKLLHVPDQVHFSNQLDAILRSLEADVEVSFAPQITVGTRALIKSGPLRGLEGFVEQRIDKLVVLLRLDFIGQAAAVKVEATELELI